MKDPVQRYSKSGLTVTFDPRVHPLLRRTRAVSWLVALLATFAAVAQTPPPAAKGLALSPQGGRTLNTAPIRLTGPGAFSPVKLTTDPIRLTGPGAFHSVTLTTAAIRLTGPGAFPPVTLTTAAIRLTGPGAFPPVTLATAPIRLTGPGAFKPITLTTLPIRLSGPASKP